MQETLLAFLTTDVQIDNPKAWLVAAMCNCCRAYWRYAEKLDRIEAAARVAVESSDDDTVERLDRELLVKRVLMLLPSADREILRLRYFEQLTAREIARARETTHGYAEKLIHRAVKRARSLYHRLGHPSGDHSEVVPTSTCSGS